MAVQIKTNVGMALGDTILLVAACLVPAASHFFALPVYKLNPMLAFLLAGLLVGRRWGLMAVNGLTLAVLLPLVSMVVTGMPTAERMLCMMDEMAAVVALFLWHKDRWATLPAVLAAVLAGKVVYYAFKAVVLSPAVLMDTVWWVQLLAVALWSGLFAVVYNRMK